MYKFLLEVAQAVLPFAMKKFENNEQIKQLEIEIKKLKKRAILFCCIGLVIGLILGFLISYLF
ncbi:MAG: hypothetical protein OXH36_03270 [Bdellovibrionales bacterium]|nr:hypothetical protein [Bdellovibrionales bacterium]